MVCTNRKCIVRAKKLFNTPLVGANQWCNSTVQISEYSCRLKKWKSKLFFPPNTRLVCTNWQWKGGARKSPYKSKKICVSCFFRRPAVVVRNTHCFKGMDTGTVSANTQTTSIGLGTVDLPVMLGAASAQALCWAIWTLDRNSGPHPSNQSSRADMLTTRWPWA